MKYLVVILVLAAVVSAQAEMRVWTFHDGEPVKAEFLTMVNEKVVLETPRGKQLKIPASRITEEDMLYIELQMPPKLKIEFAKSSKARVFPDSLSQLPQAFYYTARVKVGRPRYTPYRHELTVEFFLIGKEIAGRKKILLDYQKENFRFDGKESLGIEMTSRTVELIRFRMGGETRGEQYDGYMVAVTDSRGEVIDYKVTDEKWFQHIENLRKVPRGKTFDESCRRCFPTRPRKFY